MAKSLLSTVFFLALGVSAKPPPKPVTFQFLRDTNLPYVACENPGEILCAEGLVEGDLTGTALVRFTKLDVDLNTGSVAYGGFFDIVLDGDDEDEEGKSGSSTEAVLSDGQLAIIGLNDDSVPIYSVQSKINISGGTGYFRKRECSFQTAGSIDTSRLPYGEVLDVVGTCVVKPGL